VIFDLFHSLSDPSIHGKSSGPKQIFENYKSQAKLAESLKFDTLWLAESHFSSEAQKQTSVATIRNFKGEVGLNSDSFQLFHWLVSQTRKINLGLAAHNIVGGNGGPIASADRANVLRFFNAEYWGRTIRFGIDSGQFPYQNTPFGIGPRSELEADLWPALKHFAFMEALEIFLRLLGGETLSRS